MQQDRQKLVFSKLSNRNIFGEDFIDFRQNNTIDFEKKSIAILYAPNGVGKTSLAKILNQEAGTSFKASYDNSTFSESSDGRLFHVVADQNGRNIIEGETEDFILGDNIRAEQQLKREIDAEIDNLASKCKGVLSKYGIDKKSSLIIDDYERDFRDDIKLLAKRGNDRKDILNATLHLNSIMADAIGTKVELQVSLVEEYVAAKNEPKSILSQFLKTEFKAVGQNTKVREIGENTDAIELLNKYPNKVDCVVCDNRISPKKLLKTKELNRKMIIDQLDKKDRDLVERIMFIPDKEDFFDIKESMEHFFETNNAEIIQKCKNQIMTFGQQVAGNAIREIIDILRETKLFEKNAKHEEMLKSAPEITDDDMQFLKVVVSQSMGKNIEIERDKSDKNLKIKLENEYFIGKGRDELPLSAGEQNFLSLSFEMLKAKNSKAQIIILDDPISSFDSIYKYKIVYSILCSAMAKKMILLTHNLDLVRIVHGQRGKCFQMYIFNNGENQENGFIRVDDKEVILMTDLSEMTKFFRMVQLSSIKNIKEYLIATVPFMRSFAKITGDKKIYDVLTELMHGHSASEVDIVECYNQLFRQNESADKFVIEGWKVSIQDIIDARLPENFKIIDAEEYPLLNKTLVNTIEYLKLRLMVEKKLIDEFQIPMRKETTNEIILAAYPDDSACSRNNRIQLMAKKTLINEFNHYEGNLSIFQPAIDISEYVLRKERQEIKNFFSTDEWRKR